VVAVWVFCAPTYSKDESGRPASRRAAVTLALWRLARVSLSCLSSTSEGIPAGGRRMVDAQRRLSRRKGGPRASPGTRTSRGGDPNPRWERVRAASHCRWAARSTLARPTTATQAPPGGGLRRRSPTDSLCKSAARCFPLGRGCGSVLHLSCNSRSLGTTGANSTRRRRCGSSRSGSSMPR
jgi:hypothetical protein